MSQNRDIVPSTVEPTFMSMYKALSRSWWDDESRELRSLRTLNNIRIDWIVEVMKEYKVANEDAINTQKPLQNLSILDVGCGGGYASEELACLGATVVGIDPCLELIDVAKKHATDKKELSNLTYICETVEEHSENNYEKYDIVITFYVMAYINEPKLFLEKCVKCLKPGGIIIVCTQIKSWACYLLFKTLEYVRHLPKGIFDYNRFSTPQEIQATLEENNCIVRNKPVGFRYSMLSNTWSWCSFAQMGFGLHGRKERTN